MKTLCQLLLAVVLATSLHAQTLSLNNDTFNVTGFADVFEIIAYGTLANNTADSIEVGWMRVIEDIPSGWASLICDNNTCYTENVSVNPLIVNIVPNGTSNLDVHIQAADIPGNGTVVMRAWVIGDSANTVITGVYKITAQEPTVGINPKQTNENLLLYPNPAKDYVMIKNLPVNEISTVEIYNIFGRKMLSFSQPPSANASVAHKFDLAALPKGIYMLRVFDGDMNVIYTKSLSKE